ncbi:MAG: aspartate/glutamate racemase family protein [Aeromicrobium sp.]|uniref:aspartate/glutamate racemase family protein n=1 Tax=Aeromicrobium sp. TaxID=1871063 RepID=UPI0039E680AB
MTTIRVINPNTTVSMTAAIGACAAAVAGPEAVVEAVSPVAGPVSLESQVDDALAVPGMLARVAEGEAAGVDGYVIACFGDPGLAAARELAAGPVVGIAEAAMRTAAYLGRRFSIVTTLARTVPHIEELAVSYGLERQCAGVHASGIAVVDLETDPLAREKIAEFAEAALVADRSDVIVLGCAGMTEFTAWLAERLGVPVVDGVAAATATVAGLLRQGLRTSKRGEFAVPGAKPFTGTLAAIEPRALLAR